MHTSQPQSCGLPGGLAIGRLMQSIYITVMYFVALTLCKLMSGPQKVK